MAEYISREEVMSVIANMQIEHHYDAILLVVADKINELKATDVQLVDRWISVDNKLPEQDEKVLVLTKDKDIMTMIYKVIPSKWYKPKFGGFDKDYVTHWQPFPESIKG